jgi:3-oxoacyl-[acyl-carrier-protein] synthase II
MSSKRRVVITGLGMATSLGITVDENWQKALEGQSGIQELSLPNTEKSPVRAVGSVKDDDWKRIQEEFSTESEQEGERKTLFALWSAKSALDDAGLINYKGPKERCGVVLASGMGINRLEDIHKWTNQNKEFDLEKFGREHKDGHPESLMKNNANRPAALIAKKYGLGGYNSTITTACASATQAIGTAYRAIYRGDADMIVSGGADSMINPIGLVFFVLLSAATVSTDNPREVCRPFDRKRSGLVMGEGSGMIVLEEESHALKRGAKIYAEVAGYASTMDAYKVTAPHPKGIGAERAMTNALRDANINPDGIDYINAHGTSTKLNDAAETLAIKNVFKDHARNLSVTSSKALIGHLLAASGGPEFVFTALTVNRDEIHPTINQHNPDPKCDLDYVPNIKRAATVRAAISNSFGFGGQNGSIVVKKYC